MSHVPSGTPNAKMDTLTEKQDNTIRNGTPRAENMRRTGVRNVEIRRVVEKTREAVGEALTLAGIAERLNAVGYRTARDRTFRPSTVAGIVVGTSQVPPADDEPVPS